MLNLASVQNLLSGMLEFDIFSTQSPLSQRDIVTSLSLLCCYFPGKCSDYLYSLHWRDQLLYSLDPPSHVQASKWTHYLCIPNGRRKLNSAFSTRNFWNLFLFECFSEDYNLRCYSSLHTTEKLARSSLMPTRKKRLGVALLTLNLTMTDWECPWYLYTSKNGFWLPRLGLWLWRPFIPHLDRWIVNGSYLARGLTIQAPERIPLRSHTWSPLYPENKDGWRFLRAITNTNDEGSKYDGNT